MGVSLFSQVTSGRTRGCGQEGLRLDRVDFFSGRLLSVGTGGWWSPHPQKCSGNDWTWPLVPWSNWQGGAPKIDILEVFFNTNDFLFESSNRFGPNYPRSQWQSQQQCPIPPVCSMENIPLPPHPVLAEECSGTGNTSEKWGSLC